MIFTRDVATEAASAAAKLAPPAAVATASASGLSLQEWVYVVTIAYVVLQSLHLGWKWFREWMASRAPA